MEPEEVIRWINHDLRAHICRIQGLLLVASLSGALEPLLLQALREAEALDHKTREFTHNAENIFKGP